MSNFFRLWLKSADVYKAVPSLYGTTPRQTHCLHFYLTIPSQPSSSKNSSGKVTPEDLLQLCL